MLRRRFFNTNEQEELKDYLNFTNVDNTTNVNNTELEIMLIWYSGFNTEYILFISYDKKEWIPLYLDAVETFAYPPIYVKPGETVYVKGNFDTMDGFGFSFSRKTEAHGNILSLLYGDNFSSDSEIKTDWCFYQLFSNCNTLITAPILPSKVLKPYCYFSMFKNCSSLTYIKMLALDISATSCLEDWVNGVYPKGVFVKNKDATWDVRGADSIPEGWTTLTSNESEMNAVLQVDSENGKTGIDVFNYMLANSIPNPVSGNTIYYCWYAKDNDNIMLSGTFDGITLNNARITGGSYYSASGEATSFELLWEGQGIFHMGVITKDGYVDCWDDD